MLSRKLISSALVAAVVAIPAVALTASSAFASASVDSASGAARRADRLPHGRTDRRTDGRADRCAHAVAHTRAHAEPGTDDSAYADGAGPFAEPRTESDQPPLTSSSRSVASQTDPRVSGGRLQLAA